MIEVKEQGNYGRAKVSTIKGDTYFVPVIDGKEHRYIAETADVAMLLGLQIKYQGLNSQFAKNACRMLGIDSEWAK